MGFLGFLILGFLAAIIAKAIFPGREHMGWLGTLAVGIVGALLGGWIVGMITGNDPMDGFFELSSWAAAIVGSLLVIWIVGLLGRGDKV